MSKKKNEEILNSISSENLKRLTKEALIDKWMENELAGQRVFYVWLKQHGYKITPEAMDKNQSDGIVGNTIIECKLNENEGGGPAKAYLELYDIIPKRLKSKGEKIPYYRVYIELETFLVEVYDCHCKLVDKFDWYDNYEKFEKYFNNQQETFEYDLTESDVDLVEVIQNIYKCFGIKEKIEAYKKLEEGVIGWFKPFDIAHCNINKLILNNDKMNEKYVQKVEGAFFTPSRYIKVSTQYVINAINDCKKDGYDDFVIIDRCVGVGNLESQFPEEYFSHFILGTINEAEAFTANIRFGNLANVIVLDSLSEKGVNYFSKAIQEYKKQNKVKRLAVIFLENPPYLQTNSNKDGGVGKTSMPKTWVKTQMKKFGDDLDEQFVWSAFNYYNPYAYIHYGPIKIWKSRHMINKEVKDCYLCNRKYFNAGESSIALIHWINIDKNYDELHFDNDIDHDFVVKKVNNTISDLYGDDGQSNGVVVIEARNYSFASPRLTGSINDDGKYGHKWISEENLLKVIPLFCVCRDEFSESGTRPDGTKDYRVIDTVYKSSDGGADYQKDKKFLQNCLLYALCTQKNGCTSQSKFWSIADKLLEDDYKNNKIYKLYNSLVIETGLNGLANIEKFQKLEYGKLWNQHNLFPKVKLLKELLREFAYDVLRPAMVKYELLK